MTVALDQVGGGTRVAEHSGHLVEGAHRRAEHVAGASFRQRARKSLDRADGASRLLDDVDRALDAGCQLTRGRLRGHGVFVSHVAATAHDLAAAIDQHLTLSLARVLDGRDLALGPHRDHEVVRLLFHLRQRRSPSSAATGEWALAFATFSRTLSVAFSLTRAATMSASVSTAPGSTGRWPN